MSGALAEHRTPGSVAVPAGVVDVGERVVAVYASTWPSQSDRVVGTLDIEDERTDAFDDDDRRLFEPPLRAGSRTRAVATHDLLAIESCRARRRR
jgi:hypothetical protein